jgi:hypothetical protein
MGADVEHRDDVGVGELGQRARLAEEAVAGGGVPRPVAGELERDRPPKLAVVGGVDHAHTPRGDPSLDLKAADAGAYREDRRPLERVYVVGVVLGGGAEAGGGGGALRGERGDDGEPLRAAIVASSSCTLMPASL